MRIAPFDRVFPCMDLYLLSGIKSGYIFLIWICSAKSVWRSLAFFRQFVLFEPKLHSPTKPVGCEYIYILYPVYLLCVNALPLHSMAQAREASRCIAYVTYCVCYVLSLQKWLRWKQTVSLAVHLRLLRILRDLQASLSVVAKRVVIA